MLTLRSTWSAGPARDWVIHRSGGRHKMRLLLKPVGDTTRNFSPGIGYTVGCCHSSLNSWNICWKHSCSSSNLRSKSDVVSPCGGLEALLWLGCCARFNFTSSSVRLAALLGLGRCERFGFSSSYAGFVALLWLGLCGRFGFETSYAGLIALF